MTGFVETLAKKTVGWALKEAVSKLTQEAARILAPGGFGPVLDIANSIANEVKGDEDAMDDFYEGFVNDFQNRRQGAAGRPAGRHQRAGRQQVSERIRGSDDPRPQHHRGPRCQTGQRYAGGRRQHHLRGRPDHRNDDPYRAGTVYVPLRAGRCAAVVGEQPDSRRSAGGGLELPGLGRDREGDGVDSPRRGRDGPLLDQGVPQHREVVGSSRSLDGL